MGFSQQQRVGNWNRSPDPVSALRSHSLRWRVERRGTRMESSCFNQFDTSEHYFTYFFAHVLYILLYLILKME